MYFKKCFSKGTELCTTVLHVPLLEEKKIAKLPTKTLIHQLSPKILKSANSPQKQSPFLTPFCK